MGRLRRQVNLRHVVVIDRVSVNVVVLHLLQGLLGSSGLLETFHVDQSSQAKDQARNKSDVTSPPVQHFGSLHFGIFQGNLVKVHVSQSVDVLISMVVPPVVFRRRTLVVGVRVMAMMRRRRGRGTISETIFRRRRRRRVMASKAHSIWTLVVSVLHLLVAEVSSRVYDVSSELSQELVELLDHFFWRWLVVLSWRGSS